MVKEEKLLTWFKKNKDNIVVPNIQRDFVWKSEQIIKLFESICRGYFIGLIWVWNNTKEIERIGCWALPREYSSKNCEKQQVEHKAQQEAIIDGQQRLSALNIGLFGTYNTKKLYL